MRFPAAIARPAARLAGMASRALRLGGGTSIPGVVLLRLRPGSAAELATILDDGCVMVSATNGKTTTARMLRACLEGDRTIVANQAGANLIGGLTTALLAANGPSTKRRLGVFEVDEAALDGAVTQIAPRVVVLMNLFRDQLDRYGELETLAGRWRTMVARLPRETTVVANVDDPAIAGVVDGRDGVIGFGIGDTGRARPHMAHAADSTTCRRCGSALTYDAVLLAHQGHWRCDTCGWRRPVPDVIVRTATPDGLLGTDVRIDTPAGPIDTRIGLPGLHNVYNAAAAAAAAVALGEQPATIGDAIAGTDAAFGRAERVTVDGRELVLLLAKNPTGANENVRTVLLDPEPLHLLVALNDRTADGQDVSWIWDVDYEIAFDRIESLTVTGDRAHDLALRFRYGGLPDDRVEVLADHRQALTRALAQVPAGGVLYALPTYTAMLELRDDLDQRGVTEAFWKQGA